MNKMMAVVFICILIALSSFAATSQKICIVGNSIAATTKFPDTLQNLLTHKDADRYSWTVINEGVSSTTMLRKGNYPYWSTTGGQSFQNVFTQQPNIVAIELGTNDCKSYNWDTLNSYFVGDYEAMIDTFSHIASHPTIYLVIPTPLFQPDTGEIRDSCLQSMIPRLWQVAAEKDVPVIDVHTMLTPFSSYFADGIHPSSKEGADSIGCVYYHALTGRSARSSDTARKPYMIVSDTVKKFVVSIGQTGTSAEQVLDIANPYSPRMPLDSVTITGQASWLTIRFITRTNHHQRMGFYVDYANVPPSPQIINDTLTLTSSLASPSTKKVVVRLTIRQPPVVTSFILYATPDTTIMQPGVQRTFTAVAYNQYGEKMVPQPAFSWSASSGSISGGVYTSPATSGVYTIQASTNSLVRTCTVVVSEKITTLPSGNITQLLLLQNASTGSRYSIAPNGNSPSDSNYFSVPESTIVPMPDSSVTINGTKYIWKLVTKSNGRWFDSTAAANFMGIGALYVYSPSARKITVTRRDDYQIAMKVNNRLFIESIPSQWGFDTAWDHTTNNISLKKGMNLFMFKMYENAGSSPNFFSVRFTDSLNTMSLQDIAFQFTPTAPAVFPSSIYRKPSSENPEAFQLRYSKRFGIHLTVPANVPITIGVFDLNGKLVHNGTIKKTGDYVITRNNLRNGLYVLRITSSQNTMLFCRKLCIY
jgi:alpha-L-fucosidase 2